MKASLAAKGVLVAAITYAAYTAWLVARTFWFLSHSMTSTLHIDSLVMVDELRLFHAGKYSISYLWAPYWGHRILIPRLLLAADERWFHFSNTPLVVVSVVAQVLTTALLCWIGWRALRNKPTWIRIFAISATLHLALSALQLETFLFGMAVIFTEGLLAAFSAIALCALYIQNAPPIKWKAAATCACALTCVLTMGTGVFLGPVLALIAFGLRASARVVILLAFASVAFGAAYSIGYNNPGSGMGVAGVLRDPLGALRITALVLGGPVTDQSRAWGAVCGGAGIALILPSTIRLLQRRASREQAALTGFCLFLALHAFAFALGRFTPHFIDTMGTVKMLGSHDFTVPLLFWGTALTLVLTSYGDLLSKALCVVAACVVADLTLFTVPSQLVASMFWLEYQRTLDVAGAGMILGAAEEKFLFELYPDQRILDYYRPYMQEHGLSFFSEERAGWMGKRLGDVFGNPADGCLGSIDVRVQAGRAVVRLEGFADGMGVRFPFERQIVFTDATGKIDGLGNTLATYERRGGQSFVAYADDAAVAAYVITADRKACRLSAQLKK